MPEDVQKVIVVVEAFFGPARCDLVAQGLAYAVHLIVVRAVWKREKLIFEISKPWRLLREEYLTVSNFVDCMAIRISLSYRV